MSFILIIIAILLGLLLVLLAVPITVTFKIDRIKEIRGQLNFHWLFGLIRIRSVIPSASKEEPQHKRKPPKETRKRKPGAIVHRVVALLKQSAFRSRVLRFIKDLLRATDARDLYLHLRIGLGDPADTGCLWVILGPIAGIATNFSSVEVLIEPDFMDLMLKVESHGKVSFIPLQFIALATAFLLSSTTLRAWCALRQSNA